MVTEHAEEHSAFGVEADPPAPRFTLPRQITSE